MNNWEKEQDFFKSTQMSTFEVPDEIFKELKEKIYQGKEKKFKNNDNLVGHIKEEYKLEITESLQNYIVSSSMNGVFGNWQKDYFKFNTHNRPIVLDDLWVNFQKKYEFNPLHNYSGFGSFIIFVQIPYDLKEEESYYSDLEKDEPIYTSKLTFLHHLYNGELFNRPINVDKSFCQKMIMFSSKQLHSVYPFYTSDDYRITISGNLKFDTR